MPEKPDRLRRSYVLALTIFSLAGERGPASPPLLSAQQTGTSPASLVFKDVTVIDVAEGRRLAGQTVLVVGNRIVSVTPAREAKPPRDARIIDANGKYLVPGFWDMHTHVYDDTEQLYPLFVANGITGIREMAQRGRYPDSFPARQRAVMAGTRLGPRTIGPSADLSNLRFRTAEDVVRIIDSLKAAGDVFVKFHGTQTESELFLTMAREARRVGLPVVGHLPVTLPNVQAVDSGLMNVEHIIKYYDCVQRPDKTPIPAAAREQECATIARAYIRNGTWLTPTIAVDYYRYFQRKYRPLFQDNYQNPGPRVFFDYERYVRTLYDRGVRRFLAGTDCGGGPVCGFSALQEIVILGESGLPALDALRAATLHPAQYLGGTDSLGTVAAGKLADLVLLDADPLADIHNVLKIRAVVANGRYFDRAALDAMDPKAIELSKAFAAEWTGSERRGP